jgi:hypothetical protein
MEEKEKHGGLKLTLKIICALANLALVYQIFYHNVFVLVSLGESAVLIENYTPHILWLVFYIVGGVGVNFLIYKFLLKSKKLFIFNVILLALPYLMWVAYFPNNVIIQLLKLLKNVI